jgi:hypothetical protein
MKVILKELRETMFFHREKSLAETAIYDLRMTIYDFKTNNMLVNLPTQAPRICLKMIILKPLINNTKELNRICTNVMNLFPSLQQV